MTPFGAHGRVSVTTPEGTVETWYIPPSYNLRRPPPHTPIVVPPKAEVRIMTAFPGPDVSIRVTARNEQGEMLREFNYGGYCGGVSLPPNSLAQRRHRAGDYHCGGFGRKRVTNPAQQSRRI